MDVFIYNIMYWISYDDYKVAYSEKGNITLNQRKLMEQFYIELWLIMYPTRVNSTESHILKLSNLFYLLTQEIKGKIQLISAFTELYGSYLRRIKSILCKEYGYPNLTSQLGYNISEVMAGIFSLIAIDISTNKRKNKEYQISKERIESIIKEMIEFDT